MDDSRILLDHGQLVPPSDKITANGLELWRDSPPLYHDLTCISYTANDVREWVGRLKKYKAEIISYAEKCRNLYKEIANYEQILSDYGTQFEEFENRIELVNQKEDELDAFMQAELAKKNLSAAECLQLKKAREQIQKQKESVTLEIAQICTRTGHLKTEVEQNRARHLAALGEKERLKLERRWFFRERLLLEETTLIEVQDIAVMKEKLEKLRHCLHKAWEGTKQMDLLGHLRATKHRAYSEEWYKARRRTFTRKTTSHGVRYVDVSTAKQNDDKEDN